MGTVCAMLIAGKLGTRVDQRYMVGFGLLLGTFTDKTAESPYGAVGLVALFSGFFLMMGFIWATIGE